MFFQDQDVPKSDVYGNARIVTAFFVTFSVGIILFSWLVPSDWKKADTMEPIL